MQCVHVLLSYLAGKGAMPNALKNQLSDCKEQHGELLQLGVLHTLSA